MFAVPDGVVWGLIPQTGFLRSLVGYASTQTDAPLIFHVATGLALLASVLPPSLHYWGPGSETYPNLYVVVVGGSGVSRKTASMRIGRKLLSQSVPDRVGVTPLSYGALVDSLEKHPQQIIFDEDMARFLKESKGAGYLSSLKQGYLTAYDCGKLDLTGRTRGQAKVDDPRLSLYSAVNMTELSDHLDLGDLSSGFLSRFVFFSGQRTRLLARKAIEPKPDHENYLRWMLQRTNECAPRVRVAFSPEAEATLDAWEETMDHHLRTCEDPQESSLLSRVPEFSRKIAVLYAIDLYISSLPIDPDVLACHGATLTVSKDCADRALLCAQMAHASVLSVLQHLHFSPDMRDRSRVIDSIPPGQPTALGVITQRSKLLKGNVLRILDTLEEEKVIQKQVTQSGNLYYRTGTLPLPPAPAPAPVATVSAAALDDEDYPN